MDVIKNFNILLNNFKNFKDIKLKREEDIKKLPFTRREDLINLNTNAYPQKPFNITSTSGSSGKNLLVYHSKKSYEKYIERILEAFKLIGITKNDVFLNMISYSLSGEGRMIDEALKTLNIPSIPLGSLGNKRALSSAIKIIKKYKPTIIYCYVNEVFPIFNELRRHHSVQKTILSGEILLTEFKKQIEDLSGTGIYDYYGCMEVGGLAINEKPKDTMLRLIENGLYTEVLKENGEISSKGKGKIIVTDLYNISMPFIRYIIGDKVEIKEIGRKRYIKILGREDDHINIHGQVESKKELTETIFKILKHPAFSLLIDKDKTSYKDIVILNLQKRDENKVKEIIKLFDNNFNFTPIIRRTDGPIPKISSGKFTQIVDLRKLKLRDKKLGW